jgi:hypothetical protein
MLLSFSRPSISVALPALFSLSLRQMDPTATQDISQNRQSELIDIDITIVALATLFVGLRFFSRWKAGVYWGIDDYTLLLALVCQKFRLCASN